MPNNSQLSYSQFCSLWKEGRRCPCQRWGRSPTCSWWRGRWSSPALGAWCGAGGGTDVIWRPGGRRSLGGCRSPWRETWCSGFRRRWPARPRARESSGSTSSDLWNPETQMRAQRIWAGVKFPCRGFSFCVEAQLENQFLWRLCCLKEYFKSLLLKSNTPYNSSLQWW